MRQKLLIPFGGGLDRLTGSAVVDPDSYYDLRNVHLARGRMEFRTGLERTLDLGWGEDLVGIFSLRSQGLTACVVFDSTTREVRLYVVDGSLTVASLVGTLWTLPALASPRVLGVDLYSKLVLAHDEPTFALRGTTRVYEVAASTISNLTADLDRDATAEEIKFRGVVRHLNYLVGWGYGTGADEDRPEVLRISKPGAPTILVPEVYFLVGAPGEPIIGAGKVGERSLALHKGTESHRLDGVDLRTFGVFPADETFGLITSRSHVTVGKENFRWSLDGPRVSVGGESADLEFPLDILGPDADPLLSATEAENGFAFFDPKRGEVVFVFDHWAYVLHTKGEARRWSYREYGRVLSSVGLIYLGSGSVLSLPAALIGVPSYVDPTYVGADFEPSVLVPWTLSEATEAGDQVEVWAKSDYDTDAWELLATVDATDLAATVEVLRFLTETEVAVRLMRGGVPGAGYTGLPDSWPATARATLVTGGTVSSFTNDGPWGREHADYHGTVLGYAGAGMGGSHPELSFEYEHNVDGGGWVAHVTVAGTPLTRSRHDNPSAPGSVAQYRVTVVGPDDSTAVTGGTVTRAIGADKPSGTSIDPDTGDTPPNHLHPIEVVSRGANGADGVMEMQAYHTDGGSTEFGTVDEVSDPTLVGVSTINEAASPATPRDAFARTRIRCDWFGQTDYSEYDISGVLNEP